MRPPGLLEPRHFASMTDEELHKVKLESDPGSNYWEWAAAEQQERRRLTEARRDASGARREKLELANEAQRQMKIFWSWQSDTPGKTGRFLVRDALKEAVEHLKQTLEIDEPAREALHVDHDIQNVPGSPDLARTIFDKVEASEIVVADVTAVGRTVAETSSEKKLINSNVAIELGYAFHACTDRRVLLVFNEHYGTYEELPFDLRHKGGAIVFNLKPGADKKEIEAQKKGLKERFISALKPLLLQGSALNGMTHLGEVQPTLNSAAYFEHGEVLSPPGGDSAYRSKTLSYLRLIPTMSSRAPMHLAKLKDIALAAPLLTNDDSYTSISHGLNRYGAIKCISRGSSMIASTQLFENGEVWCVGASLIRTDRDNLPQYVRLPLLSAFVLEQTYYRGLRSLVDFATNELEVRPPWDVELGIAGVSEVYFNWANTQHGPAYKEEITHRSRVRDSSEEALNGLLLSFFSKVFDSVGERRPPNLHGFPPNTPISR